MSRYIDADMFKYNIEMASKKMHLICGVKGVDIGAVIKAVDLCPTADVVEVRHGKNITQNHPVDEFICSECGFITRECCRYKIDEDADGDESMLEFEFRYCPCCGAKMDGERREE